MTQENCDELIRLIEEIPTYTSWAPDNLAHLFARYKDVLSRIALEKGPSAPRWLFEDTPHLETRIEEMLRMEHTERQRIVFNSIAFELESAIDVILLKLHCIDRRKASSTLQTLTSSAKLSATRTHGGSGE